MRRVGDIYQIDIPTVLIYIALVIMGWLNIFAVEYTEEVTESIFSLTLSSGRQLVWIGLGLIPIFVIMTLDFRFFETFGYVIYGVVILLLILVLLFGREIAGSNSWLVIGPFRLQPSEFSKFATALALAKFLAGPNIKLDNLRNQIISFAIFCIPAGLIVLQGDAGTAMVFSAFLLVIYREGFSQTFMILGVIMVFVIVLTLMVPKHFLLIAIVGITAVLVLTYRKNFKRLTTVLVGAAILSGVIFSVDYAFNEILKPHQQNRIKVLINPNADPQGAGWNVTQSKIAIGSGGISGKGFLQGTQTKYDFVPEQNTDFIFCTIGEEHGWIGSLVLIILFGTLFLRVVFLAERQKSKFARVYGYSVASILFFHFAVNIGMTIGLFPVIGIPLPFFSYGGSSLWAFTILLFILLKLDGHRKQYLTR